MKSRASRAPVASATNITTPLRENTVVHHSKIDCRMAEVGHTRPKSDVRVVSAYTNCRHQWARYFQVHNCRAEERAHQSDWRQGTSAVSE